MALDLFMPVLVVDDHDTAIQTLRALLQQLGFVTVDHANNVVEALSKMRVKRHALVISDWATNEPLTGCDFLREVRGDPDLNRTLFIVAGEFNCENVVAAKKAGANGFIVRPASAETLKTKIEAVLATRTAPLPAKHQYSEAENPVATSAPPTRQKFIGRFTGGH